MLQGTRYAVSRKHWYYVVLNHSLRNYISRKTASEPQAQAQVVINGMQLGGKQTPLPYLMELRHQQLLQLYDYKVSFVIFQHLQAVLLTHVTQKSGEVCATRFSPILSPCFPQHL